MKLLVCYLFFFIGIYTSLISRENEYINSKEIPINWTDTLAGDFSFQNKWKYPDGVIINEFGQLECDGICPPEIDNMKDKNGKIIKDSLDAFYRIIDTLHQFQSILTDAWCYEWDGTDFITVRKIDDETYFMDFSVSAYHG